MIIIARLRDLYGTGLKNKKQKKKQIQNIFSFMKKMYIFLDKEIVL